MDFRNRVLIVSGVVADDHQKGDFSVRVIGSRGIAEKSVLILNVNILRQLGITMVRVAGKEISLVEEE